MRVCIVTDNLYIYEHFVDLLERKPQNAEFDFYYATWNKAFKDLFRDSKKMKPIKLKDQDDTFFNQYDLFISLHCKQLFPDKMVNEHICINVHPGYNPYNRGWFPQVFGIINKMPIGVTIHKMDTELDHGPILYQKQLKLNAYDTSKDVYDRILQTEMELVEEHLEDILNGSYELTPMKEEGNLNTKYDYEAMREIDLSKQATYGEVIDFLRAMTHPPYDNAYFYDEDGNRIYVKVSLKKDEQQ